MGGGIYTRTPPERSYLDNEGTEDDTAEDEVVEDAFKDVPFAVDLAGVDLVEKLHQYKGVEDDGVVLRGRRVEGRVPAAVNVEHLLPCGGVRGEQWVYNQVKAPSPQRRQTQSTKESYRQRAA